MALKRSSLSFACTAVRDFLSSRLEGVPEDIVVQIGSPADVSTENNQNVINLFFYRFEPGGFGPGTHPQEPMRMRVYCLVSVFGTAFDNVGAGENELRMLGEVIRLFHENPILGEEEFLLEGESEGEMFRLQVVYYPLAEDQFGQFWSSNNESGIRPSISYEFSLLPIVPETRRVPAPKVGSLGTEVRADPRRRHSPPTVTPMGPLVSRSTVDIGNPDWLPKICWVEDEGCLLTLSITRALAGTFQPRVWVAGDPGSTVELVWETWRPDEGWKETPAGAVLAVQPFTTFIDPEKIPAPVVNRFPATPVLPGVFAGVDSSQVLLYARRTIPGIAGASARTLRSNPLLISIFNAP